MNIKKMILCIITIIALVNIIFLPKVFAFSSIIEDGDAFLQSGDSGDEVIDEQKLKETSSKIYNVLLACGIGVAVVVGAVLGISFIVASAEGKAKVSEALVPYIVGCFVVFGAFGIWKIAIETGNKIANNNSDTYLKNKAEETYKNKEVWKIEDEELDKMINDLEQHKGEMDPEIYNYLAQEQDNRKILEIYNNKTIDKLTDEEVKHYFQVLDSYAKQEDKTNPLYKYFKNEADYREALSIYNKKSVQYLTDVQLSYYFSALSVRKDANNSAYTYFKNEIDNREILAIYNNKTIDRVDNEKLKYYFQVLNSYAKEEDKDNPLYKYFENEIAKRKI